MRPMHGFLQCNIPPPSGPNLSYELHRFLILLLLLAIYILLIFAFSLYLQSKPRSNGVRGRTRIVQEKQVSSHTVRKLIQTSAPVARETLPVAGKQ